MPRVYLSPPHVLGSERELLLEAFDSNWIAPLGPHVDLFEKEMCERLGVATAAALSSGTAALHLALILAGVQRGDAVICSSFTFAASANAIVYCGAEPIFIDSDATWTMDPDLLEEELRENSRRVKAVIAVDLYGQCADYQRIEEICNRHGVTVIEDAAEALGSTCRGRSAGAFGRISVLSFNGNKIITTGGGGMLLSNDPDLTRKARFLATQARDPAPHYQHSEIGYNYRLSNLLAAVGRGQLRTLDQRVSRKREIFETYRQHLAALPGLRFMPEASYGRSNRWLTCLLVDEKTFGADREKIRVKLEELDIEARPLWKPMHMQPVFAKSRVRGGNLSASLFKDGLCLPSGSSLSPSDQQRVIGLIASLHHS